MWFLKFDGELENHFIENLKESVSSRDVEERFERRLEPETASLWSYIVDKSSPGVLNRLLGRFSSFALYKINFSDRLVIFVYMKLIIRYIFDFRLHEIDFVIDFVIENG